MSLRVGALPLTQGKISCFSKGGRVSKPASCSGLADRNVHSRVTMTTYNPISENLIATEPENGGEAKGNCVVVRRGGKQPRTKEQSQIQVNSIRYLSAASLRATGEACAERNPCPWHPRQTRSIGLAGMVGVRMLLRRYV